MYEAILEDLNFNQFNCFEYIESIQEIRFFERCSQKDILHELVKIVNILNENDIKYKITEGLIFKIETLTLMDKLEAIP